MVKRYVYDDWLTESHIGNMVRYADYELLEKERDQLRQQLADTQTKLEAVEAAKMELIGIIKMIYENPDELFEFNLTMEEALTKHSKEG